MYQIQIIEDIREYMIGTGKSLSVAESVTSGHLQAALSLASEASKFFQGGITAYNLGQKARHLRVDPIHATSCNSVSQTIADEMAIHANEFFNSDWAIAVTGYAAPMPEMGIKDLFAFYAFARDEQIVFRGKVESKETDALEVQVHYVNHIFEKFRSHLFSIERSAGSS